jgi:serine/threonine-protein kinase
MKESPCPEPTRLRQLLDETLPSAEQAALAVHLNGCAQCQQTLERLAAGQDSWAGARAELAHTNLDEPAEPALARVVAALAEHEGDETMAEKTSTASEALTFLAPPARPGDLGRLGHYEVLEVIGRGGFGIVLKAVDEKLQRIVAIKVLAPELAANAGARRRFSREAQAVAAVAHEHVVTIHAVEDQHRPPFLVMQYVAGQSLQQRLDETETLPIKEILRIGHQVASGLAAAHAQGLVHRDIKPANILMENGVQRVQITDFGLARAVEDASLSQSGLIAGTPMFMAPEQARGEPFDHRADLFSLGSVLYLMCTGRPPFRASGLHGLLRRVAEETPRPVREINPDVPAWLEAIIQKLHARRPEDRFQSADEVADLLRQHLAHLQRPQAVPLPAPVQLAAAPAASSWRRGLMTSVSAFLILFVLSSVSVSSSAQLGPLVVVAGCAAVALALGYAAARRPRLGNAFGCMTVVLVLLGFVFAWYALVGVSRDTAILIVDSDDPAIAVRLEKDGQQQVLDLKLTHEWHFIPGSYRAVFLRDGKEIRREDFTLTRGSRHVLKAAVRPPP